MAELSDHSPRRRWLWIGGGLAVLVCIFLIAFSGGGGQRPDGPAQSAPPGSESSAAALLQRQLLSTLDGLRPERLGVSSNPASQVNDLNFWWAEHQSAGQELNPPAEQELAQKLWGDPAVAVVTADRFDLRDAGHIRNSFLYRAIARHIANSEERALDRCVSAFNLATRHVALRVPGSSDAPLTSFEVLLMGRGTASDRAWVFAEILRQLNIDCVIIEPTGAGVEKPSDVFLVGAVLPDDGVYLFDPRVGLPIPSSGAGAADSVLVERPATLVEVRADDGLLRQWDVPDGPAYPLTADRLQQIAVRVMTQSTLSAGRMASLQAALPEEYQALLFDGLTTSPTRETGLLDRVRRAGSDGLWSADDVQVWDFPERQTAAFYADGGEESPALRERMDILFGPRVLRKRAVAGGETVNVIGESQQPLRYVRVQHLRGDLTDALVSYGAIRSANNGELREAVNEAAADEASYWIAVCQYELGRYSSAFSSTELYRKKNQAGVWLDSIPYLQALCLAQQGQYQSAAHTLTEASAGGALSPRDSFLIRRWQARPDVTATEE